MSDLYVYAELPLLDSQGNPVYKIDESGNYTSEPEMDRVKCKVIHWGKNPEYNEGIDGFVYHDCIWAVRDDTMKIVRMYPEDTEVVDIYEKEK